MRKLFLFAAPFSLAVLLAVMLIPHTYLLLTGGCCFLVGGVCFLWKGEPGLRVRLILFGVGVGFLWTAGYQSITLLPAQQLGGSEGSYCAQITGWPRETRYGMAVDARLETEKGRLGITLYANRSYLALKPGDWVSGDMKLTMAGHMGGEEHVASYAKAIFLSAQGSDNLQIDQNRPRSLSLYPVIWTQRLKEQVAACFPADVAPLVTGLVVGDKRGLDTATYTAFQRTGVAHVVAVSGLHVAFLAGFVVRLFGKNRRRTAFVTIILMGIFAEVAGYTPSVLRAAFLQSMLLLAPLLGREDDKPTSLSVILMLLLLQNPYAVAGVGLQLSFAAVAGIYVLTDPLEKRWTAWIQPGQTGLRRLGAGIVRMAAPLLSTTLGALAFTIPLSTFYFGGLSLVAPLANLLTLGAVALTFAGGLGVSVLGLVHDGLAIFLGKIFAWPGRYVLWIVRELSGIPLASVSVETIYLQGWLLLVYVLFLLALILRRRERLRMIVPTCACVCALCAALVCHAAEERLCRLTVSVLDVGQGQSIAMTSKGRTALLDCGGNLLRNAGDIAADYFQSAGYSQLDVLILTHFHADHALGVPELLERMKVRTLIVPDVEPDASLRKEILALAKEKGTEIFLLRENTDVTLGKASLRLYRPLGDGDANEEGLSVLCSLDEFDALITGDMNQAVEKRLLKYGALPNLELLVAGHHGSKYATSPELLHAVTPEYAAISAGYNHYGQPALETLVRLQEVGCAIYRTDWMGKITFRVH